MMVKDNYSQTLGIVFLSCAIILIGIGFGFLYSASQPSGIQHFNNQYYYIVKQGIFFVIGIFFFLAGFFIDCNFYKKYIKTIVIVTIVLLITTLIPFIGKEVGGGRRWISLRFIQFQPSEIAKLTIVFYLSFVLANKQDFIKDFYKGILPPLFMSCFFLF